MSIANQSRAKSDDLSAPTRQRGRQAPQSLGYVRLSNNGE